jgi:hypothetical protein
MGFEGPSKVSELSRSDEFLEYIRGKNKKGKGSDLNDGKTEKKKEKTIGSENNDKEKEKIKPLKAAAFLGNDEDFKGRFVDKNV